MLRLWLVMTFGATFLVASFSLVTRVETRISVPSSRSNLLSNSLNGLPGARQALNGEDASVALPGWHGLRVKMDVSHYSGTNLDAKQQAPSLHIVPGSHCALPAQAIPAAEVQERSQFTSTSRAPEQHSFAAVAPDSGP